MRKVAATLGILAVLVIGGGLVVLYTGVYNIAATQPHTAFVYWVLHTAMRRSIETRAAGIPVPDLSDPAMIERGLLEYGQHCVQCHGAPGVPPHDFAKGMMPVPPDLLPSAREWTPAELFWVVKHGVRMTGMPAWDYRFSDARIWAIIAFVRQLPTLSPAAYKAAVAEIAEPELRTER